MPSEVEAVLIDHPGVSSCGVAPLPDPVREEEVAACVVLKDGIDGGAETAAALLDHCRRHLSYFKLPGYIIFVERLPVTSTQKIQRGELRTLCLALKESEQCVDCRHLKKQQ